MTNPRPNRWFDKIRFVSKGQIYKYPNPDCYCEVTVFIHPANGNKPRCGCGAEMKKPYTKPVLTELGFRASEACIAAAVVGTRGKGITILREHASNILQEPPIHFSSGRASATAKPCDVQRDTERKGFRRKGTLRL